MFLLYPLLCWFFLVLCVCVWVKLCSKEHLVCRGTQEAHRAVSNEALYGVFRISGLITLTYLHLWNCWQAVTLRCFPSKFIFSILFRFFFKLFNPEWAKFFQLWFCALNYSWPSINFHAAFFYQLEIHGLWQAINGHCDTLVTQEGMWKQCIPSSWLIKCVFGGVFCQSPVVIPLPGGVARYSPCGVCQEISLWNISLISFGSRISLICIHCSWLDSWLHSDYLLVWHDGVEFFGWNRALTPVYESLDAGVSVFWKSDTGVSLLKIWYMSIFLISLRYFRYGQG